MSFFFPWFISSAGYSARTVRCRLVFVTREIYQILIKKKMRKKKRGSLRQMTCLGCFMVRPSGESCHFFFGVNRSWFFCTRKMAAAVVALSLLGANHSRAQRALGLACVGGAPFQRSCQVGGVLAPRGPPPPPLFSGRWVCKMV